MRTDKIKIEYVDLALLRPSEYNPKKISAKEKKELIKSIQTFGVIDPLIVNSADNRKNIIIGGHQRFGILKELGYKTAPVIFLNIP
ncbi:MAG: ParB N-terminal domain-containing protein, partial [Verrucomicrobiia bacterium]